MRRLTVILLSSIAAVAAFAAAAPLVLYAWGCSYLPGDRTPPSSDAVPLVAQQLLWADLGGVGDPELHPLTPYTLFRGGTPPGDRLAAQAARALLRRNGEESPKRWHLRFASASIWVSRHWTAQQASSAVLQAAYFGHAFIGITDAAAGYFGVAPDQLDPLSTAQLVALTRSASQYDLWCKPDANLSRAHQLLESVASRLNDAESLTPISPPAGACT